MFGTTNTQLVFNLLGNTQATKQVRELTPAVDPKKQAVWTLGDLYTYLTEYAYCIYDQNEHPALSLSPRAASEKELLLAATEIKQQAKRSQTTTILSAKRLADFLASVNEHEALLLQRWRDLEAQNLLNAPEQKSENVMISPVAVPLSQRGEIQPTPPRLEISPLDVAQIPIFEEYR